MSGTREIVVIGAGPAGVAAAIEAARHGAAVTLVANESIGGRSVHATLVPSKVLLHLVAERKVRNSTGRLDSEDMAHVRSEIERIVSLESQRLARRLSDAGVTCIVGTARFADPNTIEIIREGRESDRCRFDGAIVATGSAPRFPKGFLGDAERPDGELIIAPRHLRHLQDLPKTILVIGGGATGAEAASMFQALGVETTWILDEFGVLPGFDRELGDSLGDVLMERGVKIIHDKPVRNVIRVGKEVHASLDGGRTYAAERAFVAVGRRPDTARLGLDVIGIETDAQGAIIVDSSMRSNLPHIFAAGDSAGAPFVASKSTIEGWIAGRVAAGRPAPSVPTNAYVESVDTDPEIAMIGLTPHRAYANRMTIDLRTISFDESVKGWLHGVGVVPHVRGTMRLVIDSENERILGATAIGPRAAEALAPVAVAIRCGATLEMLATSGMAAPTFGELPGAASRA
jgi:dihydrolipoamide dehydrogenase